MPAQTARPSARERLLAAADELFYREGVHVVGIDRVIEHAGVAKASLYNTFGSKDELIRAYLEGRHKAIEKRVTDGLAAYPTPREKILGVFDIQGARFQSPEYRGCPFISATAEAEPGAGSLAAADAYRAWVRGLFADLARQAGAADPEALAQQLQIAYDGVAVKVRLDRDPAADLAAGRALAAMLLDAALGPA
ncbi:TetR/AcrR family transcriptional regulator [Asanoa iriomotensis]|uniref:Transcriptional regulator, TetR family protein n=1 Tax=Asanoa iriomotensis TaxID=234613 RepID=A0ABQ4BUE2_9ACTN|nr:TetR/AcrR family transcriptional regulator [Asanoa iriomotensis]GIF54150.1 putative transcriptional regulator, TetR family protein [Asanoa iriomotensis]